MTKPTYDPQMLTRLMWETKNIDDHAKLAQLFIDLDEQGDIEFTKKMRYEISSARHFFRFVREINDIAELCEFNSAGASGKKFSTGDLPFEPPYRFST